MVGESTQSVDRLGQMGEDPRRGECALVDVYNRYHERIYRYCFYRLLSEPAAEDATSHVFLRLAGEFDRATANGESRLRVWLYGAASNAVNGHIRKTKRWKQALARAWRDRSVRLDDRSDRLSDLDRPALHRAICQMKQSYQEVVVLRFFEQLQIEEIAEILGMKRVTVRVTILRALRKLRPLLEKSFGD